MLPVVCHNFQETNQVTHCNVRWSEHHICGSCHMFVLFNSMPSAVLIIGPNIADLWAVVECNVDDLNFVWEWVQEKMCNILIYSFTGYRITSWQWRKPTYSCSSGSSK